MRYSDSPKGYSPGTKRKEIIYDTYIYIYISFKVEKFGELKKFDSIA